MLLVRVGLRFELGLVGLQERDAPLRLLSLSIQEALDTGLDFENRLELQDRLNAIEKGILKTSK